VSLRIVVADDSVLLREGLAHLLNEAGYSVVATAEDAPALIRRTLRERPDLVVTDVRMPPNFTDDGLRAAVRIRQEMPEVAILALSQWVEAAGIYDLMKDGRGGVGYLLKDRIMEMKALSDAIEQLARGETVMDPQVVAQLMVIRDSSPLARLTAREREVLELMATGKSNSAIATALTITLGAVEKHVAAIFTKLDLPPNTADHRRVLAVLTALGIR
jgi:DNA-binding NarL/FixJ family response regulator